MRRIVFATGNEDKMREVREIMKDTGFEVVSMREAGIKTDAVENGSSFTENAVIKARAVASLTDDYVMADDSGLVIDALGGEPGIYSARYMGRNTPYHEKNYNIINRLNGVPDEKRTARFVCAVAAVFPDGSEKCVKETMEGKIGYSEAGKNGFGYDPIFFLPEYGMTSAEIPEELKNSISHRGKALRHMKEVIEKYEDTHCK